MNISPGRVVRFALAAGLVSLLPDMAGSGSHAEPALDSFPPVVRSYRLPDGNEVGHFRLLVVPVRFPEDVGSELAPPELAQRLSGDGVGSLRGYWLAASRGRLELDPVLGPLVTARHARSWYTVEGDGNAGYGTDPDAYPHNARRLVEEVTAAIMDRVDFGSFDNTGDGLADGLLLVHSGPAAPEASADPIPRDRLATHAFTLDVPTALSSGTVFAYAVASVKDEIGPWAHEVGHLLGLPDLYGTNPFFPGPGIGDWSLMATGANREGGRAPAGLDAFSLQRLGIRGSEGWPAGTDLGEEPFLKAYRKGEAGGPRYFLVERRDGADGLGLASPATVLYLVDESAGDMGDPARPLVSLRGVLCEGSAPCSQVLDDASTPSLRDADGLATGLTLTLEGTRVRIGYGDCVVIESVRLGDPRRGQADRMEQRILVTLRNLGCDDVPRFATLDLALADSLENSSLCVDQVTATFFHSIPPGESVVDSSHVLVACLGSGAVPSASRRILFRRSGSVPEAVEETRVLVGGTFGLPADSLEGFLVDAEDPPGGWQWEEGSWALRALPVLGEARLLSPWFTVPENGRLLLDHAWAFDAVTTTVALDGAVVEVLPALAPAQAVAPRLGWGYESERNLGNPLAGREVLSANGQRLHVLDLDAFSRQTVRLRFRAGGDFQNTPASWRIKRAVVGRSTPFTARPVAEDTNPPMVAALVSGETPREVPARIYAGPGGSTPRVLLGMGDLADLRVVDPGARAGDRRRYELVWMTEDAFGAGIVELRLPSPQVATTFVPTPNPILAGEAQGWIFRVPEAGPFGTYRFSLYSVTGRQVRTLDATWETPGARTLPWDGRDSMGRPPAAGVYLLECQLPDGRSLSRKVVLLP